MEPRRVITPAQVDALLSYLEENGGQLLSQDRSAEGRAVSRQAWDECAVAVNRKGESRTGRDWAKYWCELKSRVKAKLVAKTMPPLSSVEERVVAFLRQGGVSDLPSQDTVKEDDKSKSEEESEAPNQFPSRSQTEQSPRPLQSSVPRRSRQRSRATQYSPFAQMNSWIAHSEARYARLEERRAVLEERRARLEEKRARTDQFLAEAVMQRADAAVVQAEAARTQAQALTTISQAIQEFVDITSNFLAQSNG